RPRSTRPRRFCCAVSARSRGSSTGGSRLPRLRRFWLPAGIRPIVRTLNLQRHAGDVFTLEPLAGGLGLVAIEACETGAVVGLGAFDGSFDIGLGLVQDLRHLALGRAQMLLGLAFVLVGADLDGPAAAGDGVTGRG